MPIISEAVEIANCAWAVPVQTMPTIVQVNEAVYGGANPAAGGHHTCHGTEIVGPVSGVGDEVVPPLVVDVFGEDAALAHVARPLGANHTGVQLANHQSVRVGTGVRRVSEHFVNVLAISRFLKRKN